MMNLKQIKNTPVDSNSYVIYDKNIDDKCVVIDPGSEKNESLLEFLSAEKLDPDYIILTHEHFDHSWGVNGLRKRYPKVKLICSSECSEAIQDKKKNHSVFFQQPGFELAKADFVLEDCNYSLDWHNSVFKFYPALGHTAAGVVFTYNSLLFTGDELIEGIRTVTKLKTGSKDKLNDSVKLLESLKGRKLMVCSGHGDSFDLDGYDLNKVYG